MRYLLASLFLLVPGCATLSLQWGDEQHGTAQFSYTLPTGYAK